MSAVKVKVIQVKDEVDILELLRCLRFARGMSQRNSGNYWANGLNV